MKVKLKVTQVMTDGQDGSYSLSFFKDEETAKRIIAEQSGYDDVNEVEWDDEYQNGYFSEEELEFELIDGKLQLLEDELHIGHFGQ